MTIADNYSDGAARDGSFLVSKGNATFPSGHCGNFLFCLFSFLSFVNASADVGGAVSYSGLSENVLNEISYSIVCILFETGITLQDEA